MSQLVQQCVQHNIILDRWLKVIQVMLCKSAGNYNLDKLRVIQLLEADLNLYLRLVWGKNLVRHIVATNQFPAEQLGNKPGSTGSSAPLLKVLSFDLIRLLRTPATIFNNDAKACYDRILAHFSQLCCRSLGLPTEAANFMLHFLSVAQYHIKTVYGVSKDFYSNLTTAVYGVLQGSGSAPAIWLAVSIILINTYNTSFQQAGIPNPSFQTFLSKVLDAFVDDTDLWDIVLDQHATTEYLLQRLQDRAQFWEKILFATGGKLNFQKCFWYLVQWDWDKNDQPVLLPPSLLPASLSLTSGTCTIPQPIQRKSPFDALKTLGVWTSPSGSNSQQLSSISEQLHKIILNITSAHLSDYTAALIIPVYLHAKLRYIFSATTFSQSECSKLDQIFQSTVLSTMGFNSKSKHAILLNTLEY